MAVSGCASLPTSGPTAHEVLRGTQANRNAIGMRIVDIDSTIAAKAVQSSDMTTARLATLAPLSPNQSTGIVGVGDQLDIAVFEIGITLFGGARPVGSDFDPSSQVQRFPTVTVDEAGKIRLPYAGTIGVAGHTPSEIAVAIERAYKAKSQNPQVLVTIHGNVSETVFVSGDVRRSGRIEVTGQRERLLDIIANAGGTVAQTQDMVVRVTRGSEQVEERLDRVRVGAPDDLVLTPGDRVELIRRPQTFIVLGATSRVAQIPFDQSDLTLAEAVARAGGPNDATANPRAVFLFRYEAAPTAGQPEQPVIYRLDMINPASYFIAQRFPMHDKDVLYVSTAAVNRTAKFVAIINQLFSPFVAARTISGN
ncbi:polysaccharide biosynthesis/export family protein [Sphingomonas sp. CARO-RG-8B-R24-01]|uniref:polysaccharide biosynthesis/export family protein n=1 Tax=Sphingomonas sp. CARO-RG-8B-R24-01 TaxID=2914831 RepID=UPI001F57FA95|nr:polysaccharide biosynthesis/export family protein [Sphingomonas sp. CARO-RG-8B-R24-01]